MSSAILSADDLNDFISPGVACIKPIETLPKEEDTNPYEVTTEDKVQAQNPAPASISLTDCLACSGCVTSAEAVLVSLQSHTEVLNTLDSYESLLPSSTPPHSQSKLFVASVSPQVRASLAATFGISEQKAGNMIEQLLGGPDGLSAGGEKNSSFQYIFDTNRTREACLVLGADEVLRETADKSKLRPLISSACPGWICYAEKTHPHVLPHLSAVKSPQALMGTLLKSVLSKKFNIDPSQIWHLAIMPCFDKKLEASREELTDNWWRASKNGSQNPVRDVDCVITSRELISLAEARGIRLAQLPQSPVFRSQHPFPDTTIAQFLQSTVHRQFDQQQQIEAGSSGGYMYHMLKTKQASCPGSNITMIKGRNSDVVDFHLVSANGEVIMKCARYYGFRNIQNLVRKLKPTRQSKLPGAARRGVGRETGGTDYAYVEVMACPGGCTNGGGQIKVEDVVNVIPDTRGEQVQSVKSVQSQREWLNRVDEAYFSAESDDDASLFESDNDTSMTDATSTSMEHELVNGIAVKEVHNVLEYWSRLVDVPSQKLAYTTYRKVESDVGKKKPMGDTERIAAIAGMSGGGW